MSNNLTSVIIPSRNERFLQRTVDDLLEKAKGDIEIIIVLDGYNLVNNIKDDKRVIVIHHGCQYSNYGMRESINFGVKVSKGKFILKIDEHCCVDEGFDLKLIKDCEDNWVVTPRRFRLDDVNWSILKTKHPAVDNMYFTCPKKNDNGLNGKEWVNWHYERKSFKIDDCLMMQGSFYFMTRKHWNWMGGLDTKNYGKFHFEPQEIVLKTWLGGGRVITNKNIWYAHRYRPSKEGCGYCFNNNQYRELGNGSKGNINKWLTYYWINNKWDKQTRDFEWLIDKFSPIPEWGHNWEKELKNIL